MAGFDMFEQAPDGERTESDVTPSSSVGSVFTQGTLCGKYRIVRLLARGGMSQVFEAVHADLRKHVALKVLSPTLRNDREAHMRFAAEAINAACLVHTNIVDVVDCGVVEGLPYLVTNLLIGCDLATHIAKRGKLGPSEIVDILLPVANAVAFGHRRGVMHRDLKPENIFLHNEGSRVVPKVLDFGVSRMLGAPRITAEISVVGTPHYMAPEQARAEKSVGPAADQYALGVILYEALTGRLPRNSDQSQALLYSVAYGSFPPPSTYVKLPVALEQILLKAMAPDPEQRFGSMHELAAALLPFASPEYQAAARPRSNPNHRTGSGEAQRHAPAGNSEQLTVGHAQVLDIPTLLALLGERKGLVAACIAGLLTLSGTCLWLAEPNGLPVLRAAPAQHLVRAKVAPQPHPQRAQR